MGYKGVYKVYTSSGKCLGKFAGWTGEEAAAQALKHNPGTTITKVVPAGDLSTQQ
jgi:hypothetical protein